LKVAFDEHVPPVMAKVVLSLAKERPLRRITSDFVIESAKDYAPKKTDHDYVKGSDEPWLTRFAKAGGRGIISGDVRMRKIPHERLALYQHNFVVVFFEAQWGEWDFCRKSGLFSIGGLLLRRSCVPRPTEPSGPCLATLSSNLTPPN
jgi:PIN like domain